MNNYLFLTKTDATDMGSNARRMVELRVEKDPHPTVSQPGENPQDKQPALTKGDEKI